MLKLIIFVIGIGLAILGLVILAKLAYDYFFPNKKKK